MGGQKPTKQTEAHMDKLFEEKLDKLIRMSIIGGVEPSTIGAVLYQRIMQSLINQSDDEVFIEEVIGTFSSTLRKAVQQSKELNEHNKISK